MRIDTDFLVLGSGVAGMYFALEAAKYGNVILCTKKSMMDTATRWAQGGVAAVMGGDDSIERHVEDTIKVGAGLCHRDIVEMTSVEGAAHVQRLIDMGAQFDRDGDGALSLGREGGHSVPRVVHHKDMTGYEIQRTLMNMIHRQSSKITVLDNHIAIDLISRTKLDGSQGCLGAYVLDKVSNEIKSIVAKATILATGGAGKSYVYTSNPDLATGDGVAMAYRIGAKIANMEFVQFHPTCMYHPHAKSFLITESMRGDGAVLKRTDGYMFMKDYHDMQELAPRDVIAQAIDNELKNTGDDFVFLDVTHLNATFLRDRYPTIYKRCLDFKIDITKAPIPVVPAAHYMCGGVATDEYGQTSIPQLYAIGEVACTGLHGACRMACNSILEGLVFAHRAAQHLSSFDVESMKNKHISLWQSPSKVDMVDAIVVSLNWKEIRRLTWSYLGIVRSDKRIARAKQRLALLSKEISEYYQTFPVTPDIIELRNVAQVASLIAESADRRKESRGLHYMLDYPKQNDAFCQDTELFLDRDGYVIPHP